MRAKDSAETTYWLPLVGDAALQELIAGVVSEELKARARHLLAPPTRTDAGVTTSIYKLEYGDDEGMATD